MFKRLFKRLAQDQVELRAESIRAWASGVPGVVQIAEVEPRSVARIAGVVEGLRVRPREGVPAIEAVLSDGTGTVTAVWLGRRELPGLALGSRLILEGRLGGTTGRLQVMNPTFEFAPGIDAHDD
ncbi:MAG TPA: OB-fold nucleic acid binding domain-containing protein [Actinomycetota bacterium]|nr:OB-fold nucleic acid binding domain-containing protein [Actinomycetota bacterium]